MSREQEWAVHVERAERSRREWLAQKLADHAVIPLGVAAVCVEDDAIFPVTERRCPHCGSDHFVLLERWLREKEEK